MTRLKLPISGLQCDPFFLQVFKLILHVQAPKGFPLSRSLSAMSTEMLEIAVASKVYELDWSKFAALSISCPTSKSATPLDKGVIFFRGRSLSKSKQR